MKIGEHDQRVLELMEVVDTSETADKKTQKQQAKAKGYLDDEFDLAYCLKGVKFSKGPLPTWLTTTLLTLLGLGIIAILITKKPDAFQIGLLGFLPLGLYRFYLHAQRYKFVSNIFMMDFAAAQLNAKECFAFFNKVKNELHSDYLKSTGGSFGNVMRLTYDNRPTYLLFHSYTVGSGKNSRHYTYTLVIQEHKRTFPNAFCFDKRMEIPNILFRDDVELEGVEFNKKYRVYTKDNDSHVDAFYVLNPRVMAKMLEPNEKEYLKLFETTENLVITGFAHQDFGGVKVRAEAPVIPFDEYRKVKETFLKYLDITTDLTDVLMREIVDKGENRNQAKEM
jgi:hypothetical protein